MPAPTPRPASGAPAPGSSTLATPRASARRAIDASDLDRSEQVSQRFPSSLLTNYTCPNLSGAQHFEFPLFCQRCCEAVRQGHLVRRFDLPGQFGHVLIRRNDFNGKTDKLVPNFVPLPESYLPLDHVSD